MIRPEELKKDEPLLWSTGAGTDVWEMFRASMSGDVALVKQLLARDPSLVRGAYAYRRPMYFAVRENQVEVAAVLLEHGADPMVELFLRRGAKPNLPDDPPWATPLAWATRRGQADVAELLRQHGAK